MKREEFVRHVEKTLSELKLYTELHFGKELPIDFVFEWVGIDKIKASGKKNVIELIVDKIYINKNKIYPCVDLIAESITPDNKILIKGHIAGYEPREFSKGWSNRPGPFIYGLSSFFSNSEINTESKEFKKNVM